MAFFQVLPKEDTAGSLFGKGFSQGFGGTLQDQLGQFFEQRQENRELQNLQSEIGKLSPETSLPDRLQAIMMAKASPQTKQKFAEIMKLQGASDFAKKFREGKDISEADLIEGMAMGYIDPGYAQAKIKEIQSQKMMDKFLKDVIPRGEETPSTISPTERPISTESPQPLPIRPAGAQGVPNINELQNYSMYPGEIGKGARARLDQIEKQKRLQFDQIKEEQHRREYAHTATADYAKDLREKSAQAEDVLFAIDNIRGALKKGATGAKALNIGHAILKDRKNPLASLFVSEDMQVIKSGTKALAGGFRNLFGSKPTQSEFFWYEDILPDLLKSQRANEAGLKYFEKVASTHDKMQKISDEITAENGGYRPIDLDARVRERMKREIQNQIKEGFKLAGVKEVNMINHETGETASVPVEYMDEAGKDGFEVAR